MANFAIHRWSARRTTLCLILILVCLLGHCLADATGVSVDPLVTLDLHGHFIEQLPLSLVIIFVTSAIFLLLHIRPLHWSKPPTTPPPIVPFFLAH